MAAVRAQEGNSKAAYSARELSVFCAQVALVLRSGMFLPDGVAAMAQESEDPVLSRLSLAVQGGSKLGAALRETGAFPEYMVGMTEIGEDSGKLEQVMNALSVYYEREYAVRNQIKSAVTYPMVLVGMMIIVIAVLLVRVLPIFAEVFADLGGAAGAISPDVMMFGETAGYIALGIAALMLFACAYLSIKLRSAKGYASLMRGLGKVGITKKLANKIAAGRFAFALSMLLESGYDLDAALDAMPGIVDNDDICSRIARCRALMAQGDTFARAVEEAGLFSGMYAHILGVGFRAGALDSVSGKIAEIYEEEIDASTARLVGVIEPTLVAMLCVVIGAILLGVMLPLMNIMTSIG